MTRSKSPSRAPRAPAPAAPAPARRIPVNPKAGGWPSTHRDAVSGRNRFQAAPKQK